MSEINTGAGTGSAHDPMIKIEENDPEVDVPDEDQDPDKEKS